MMHKILKISVILPYYEARYTLNKKIEIKSLIKEILNLPKILFSMEKRIKKKLK